MMEQVIENIHKLFSKFDLYQLKDQFHQILLEILVFFLKLVQQLLVNVLQINVLQEQLIQLIDLILNELIYQQVLYLFETKMKFFIKKNKFQMRNFTSIPRIS